MNLELEGFREVKAVFDNLPLKMQKKAVRPSLRAGAKVIHKDGKRRMAKLTGKNRKFFKVKSIKRSRQSIGVMIITGTREQLGIAGDDPFYYPAIQEHGSKNMKGDKAQTLALRTKRHEAIRAIGTRLSIEQNKIIAAMKKVR